MDDLMEHSGRNLLYADIRYGHYILQDGGKHRFQNLARRVDGSRLCHARLHLAFVFRGESKDLVLRLALHRFARTVSFGRRDPANPNTNGADSILTRIKQYSGIQLGVLVWSRSVAEPLM